MNKKEFKKYMRLGLGRCVLFLRASAHTERERYREIVLWGCLHNLSYDTQCEGTRAHYVYELTTYFDDADYFLKPSIEAFQTVPRRSDWLFSHFAELLRCFAENGNQDAWRALWQRYQALQSVLMQKKRAGGYDFERDNFERLCITLSSIGGVDILIKITKDLGWLFEKNPRYTADDFGWFCASLDDGIGKARLQRILQRASKKSKGVSHFYEHYLKWDEAEHSFVKRPIEAPTAADVSAEVNASAAVTPAVRLRFRRRSDEAQRQLLAAEILAEPDPDKKAELLSCLDGEADALLLTHEHVIGYAESPHEHLREVALELLTDCHGAAVREFALRLLEKKTHTSYAIRMLIRNYASTDKALLLKEFERVSVHDRDRDDWHAIGMAILGACDYGVKLPREFFLCVYSATPCSHCRENAVRALAKHRWLAPALIEECRYDSNCDISSYVNRYYPIR